MHALDGADEALSAARLAHSLGASEGIVEFQLAHLADKHVVRGEDAYELTEEGLNRIDGFSKRLSTKMEASLGAYSEQLVSQLEGLCDHCVYLLA